VIDGAWTVGTTDADGFWTTGFLNNEIENGTITLLLVSGFTGSPGDDLDTNDDGTFDVTPWTEIADEVAVSDGGADDQTYAATTLVANYDGLPFTPGGASRIPNGTDTDTTGDWVRNDFDGAGLPGFAGTVDASEALNTPGLENTTTPPPAPFVCGDPATLISEVQGSGAASPLAGQIVDVEAVVTAVFQGAGTLGGIFLQEEDVDADADPMTSEGLFAFTASPAAVGDLVRVRGTATEFFDLTELSPVSDLSVCSSGNPAPTPVVPVLPMASADAYEPFENMGVSMPSGLVINDVFTLWRFGEFTVSSTSRFQPTHIVSPGAPAIAQAAANALDALIVDDGRTPQNLLVTHPGQDDTNPFDATNPIRNGQTIDGLTGVMYYSFGAYRLQRTEPFVINEIANPRTAVPNAVGGTIKVGSLNVLNYFSTVDDSGSICGPLANQDCRGADTANELTRQTDKLVATLAAMDADVVGLIELENNDSASLQLLVDSLNAAVGAGTYDFVNTGTIGGDAIKQGLIYKPSTVTLEGSFATLTTAVDPRFNDQFNRPSLAQSFRANNNLGLFTAIVNHLKSKGSDCNGLGDPDTGDGQGNCNLTRTSAAAALADWANSDPTSTGSSNVLLLGDLNSYAMEDPIAELENNSFTNLQALFEGPLAYSYTFNGQLGTLDYAMASADALPRVTGTTAWHINSAEAVALDYNEEFGKPAQYYQPDPFNGSDHDPVLVGLNLLPPTTITVPTTDPLVDAEVSITGGGDSCGISAIEFFDPNTLTPAPPSNLGFPYGVMQFAATGCDVGSTVSVSVTLPGIPNFVAWYKFINDAWGVYPYSLAGNTISFSVTDGGMGDRDGVADGTIIDPSGPAIVAPENTLAKFLVSKDFSDNNPASVDVTLNCFTGLPLMQTQSINEDQAVEFIVTSFAAGDLDCTVTETEVEGYTPGFMASAGVTGVAGGVFSNESDCSFESVVDGRFICEITNSLDEVTIIVNKEWVIEGPGSSDIQPVYVEAFCSEHAGPIGSAWITPGDPAEFNVLPHYDGEDCYIVEQALDVSESDATDCDDLAIAPGSGDECTVVNTLFFEGIPALSPTGLALLVLLMLGMGAIAFRRVA